MTQEEDRLARKLLDVTNRSDRVRQQGNDIFLDGFRIPTDGTVTLVSRTVRDRRKRGRDPLLVGSLALLYVVEDEGTLRFYVYFRGQERLIYTVQGGLPYDGRIHVTGPNSWIVNLLYRPTNFTLPLYLKAGFIASGGGFQEVSPGLGGTIQDVELTKQLITFYSNQNGPTFPFRYRTSSGAGNLTFQRGTPGFAVSSLTNTGTITTDLNGSNNLTQYARTSNEASLLLITKNSERALFVTGPSLISGTRDLIFLGTTTDFTFQTDDTFNINILQTARTGLDAESFVGRFDNAAEIFTRTAKTLTQNPLDAAGGFVLAGLPTQFIDSTGNLANDLINGRVIFGRTDTTLRERLTSGALTELTANPALSLEQNSFPYYLSGNDLYGLTTTFFPSSGTVSIIQYLLNGSEYSFSRQLTEEYQITTTGGAVLDASFWPGALRP